MPCNGLHEYSMKKEEICMKIEKSLLSGSTPMLVLALLKDGDKYGYEMSE